MRGKLVIKRFQYSSLLEISIRSQVLRIKGPLGVNYLKIPSSDSLEVSVQNSLNRITIAGSLEKNRGKSIGMKINSFVSVLEMSCYSVIFGSMSFLHLEGLGLRFMDPKKRSDYIRELEMKLGNSAKDLHTFNKLRVRAFLKTPRDLILYGIDFPILRNVASSIAALKKPDKYKSKGFSIFHIN